MKYSPTGTKLAETRVPAAEFDQPRAFARDAAGNFYVTGQAGSYTSNPNIKTVKLDSALNILWSAEHDGGGLEGAADDIGVDAWGNALVTGFARDGSGKQHLVTINGSESKRLTNAGENSHPIWDFEGKKIGYWRTGVSGHFFLIDETGAILDTVEGMRARRAYDWSSNDRLATDGGPPSGGVGSYTVGYFDLATDSSVFVDEVGGRNYIHKIEWGEDNNYLYWVSTHKVAKTDIHTGQRTELVNVPAGVGVNSRSYEGMSVSPDFKHIVTARLDVRKIGNCDWEHRYKLYIMDIDGSNERELVVPE